MDISAILEVAIGLIFVWIVLSLTTIQIQEWFTTRLDKRAKDMEDAIHEMLANPDLKAQFYDHPVIRSLTAKKRSEPSRIPEWFYRYPILRGFTREKRMLPSYIPSQQFAQALFDIAMTANTESSIIQQGILRIRDDLKDTKNLTFKRAVIEELNLLAELARSAAATEAGTAITNRTKELLKSETEHFIEKMSKKYPNIPLDGTVLGKIQEGLDRALEQAPQLQAAMQSIVDQQPPADPNAPALAKVRRGVAALSVISPELNQTLNALLMNVEEYASEKEKLLAKARGNVEMWFDNSMDRLSGAFKRYAQQMALLIGFVVSLFLNVDSISLTFYLWQEPSVRQVLVAQASKYELPQDEFESNPQEAMRQFRDQFAGLNLPVGWRVTEATNAASADANCQLFPKAGQSFGIPWSAGRCLTTPHATEQSNLLAKLAGIFITALAAMQGAPFWFDMLKRAVNLRSTGPKPGEK
jgi:hypothetical protein